MKKVSLLVLCAVALGAFQPGIMAAPTRANVTIRLKNEYSQFKESMKCFRQKGWKGCTPAQRKRIAVAGVALTALIVAVVGGGTVLGLKGHKHLRIHQFELLVRKIEQNPNLIDERIVNVRDPDGVSILHYVAHKRVEDKGASAAIVQRLIAAGANVNAQDDNNDTPLHDAASERGNKEIINLLIENGAVIDAQDKENKTPLYVAVEANSLSNVQALLNKGAIVSQKDIDVAKFEKIKARLEAKMVEQEK